VVVLDCYQEPCEIVSYGGFAPPLVLEKYAAQSDGLLAREFSSPFLP
jgi:hypothetical protein